MPNNRGSGKQPNGARRGQAPSNRGRGQGKTSIFAASVQLPMMEYQNTDDFLVMDFNDMSVLSGTPSSSNRGSRGRGGARGFGAHHIIPGFPNGHQRGNFTPPNRGRGRGRGGYTPIPVVMGPPPGTPPPRSKQQKNGHQNVHPLFRGRGGGLGFVLSPERPGPKNWDLATRPLLKPIKFVRAKERLFEADPEELLQAHKMPPLPTDQLDPQTEMLAEVFEEQERETSAMPTAGNSGQDTPLSTTEIIDTKTSTTEFTGQMTTMQFGLTETRTTSAQPDLLALLLGAAGNTNGSEILPKATEIIPQPTSHSHSRSASDLFYIDTTGNTNVDPPLLSQAPLYNPTNGPVVGVDDDEEPDEIILVPSPAVHRVVSVASLASTKNQTKPVQEAVQTPIVTMETLSLSFDKGEEKATVQNKSLKSFSVPRSGRSPFVPLRARKEAKRRPRDEAWTNSLGGVFGFKDGREGLRKGDSDLDVGSEDEEGEVEDNGMEVDGDLDAFAMARFAREVNKPHMSMDDVVIEAKLQAGDYDSDNEDEDDGEDAPMEADAPILLEDGEDQEDDDEDWSDDDDDVDMTPTASFKARLQRVRERTPAGIDADEVDRTINEAEMTWADRDEDFITRIEDILDQNADILGSRGDRRTRNALFRAIQDGEADHPFAVLSSRYKKYEDVPDAIAAQWLKDRNEKAERKRLREQERAEQGGLGNGRTKGKTQDLDLEDIEQMMRDLLFAGPGAPKSFQLPKLEKKMRERVHLMAQALSLKSSSSGGKKDAHKTMTISRTKNSGMQPVKEGMLDTVMRRKGARARAGGAVGGYGVGGIREGEVIGHKAAKIDEGNIGYRLLAQMGWTEGDKIGKEGGLEAPIVAVMKKTKLGLGASFA